MANPNIFAQYAQPLRSVQDYSNEMARGEFLEGQNAMQRQAMQQGQQQQAAAAARQNALMAIASETGGDPAQMVPALYRRGFVAEAQNMEKHRADVGKTGADAGKANAETAAKQAETKWKEVDRLAQELAFVKTPEDVVAYAQRGAQVMGLSPEQTQQAVQKALSYSSVEAYVADAQRQAIPLVKQFEEQAAMARSRLQADTSIATNAATNATSRANTNARIAEDRRQFGVTETRLSAPKTDAPPKPLPPTALKMQQEALDAIGIASTIQADMAAVEKQITGGKLSFGPVSNLTNQARNAVGMSSEESRNFSTFKATLERLRNESLRLNTGVQTDGDAQRAWNELFQSINDTELVKQRLQEIQRINARGAQLQRLKVDSVRANYGNPPLDDSAYSNQPPVLNGGGASGSWEAPKPGSVLKFDAQGNPVK